MTPEATQAVRSLLVTFMSRWLDNSVSDEELRMMREQSISPNGHLAPFHEALVPGIALLQERSFSTRLGGLHEQVAVIIARSRHSHAERAYTLTGSMAAHTKSYIQQRSRALEQRQVAPDAVAERAQLLQSFGETVTDSTVVDLRVVAHDGSEYFFEMKTAKPNKAQSIRPVRRRFFDFDREVKMGCDFWNFLGGEGAYGDLMEIYAGVGAEFAARVAPRMAGRRT